MVHRVVRLVENGVLGPNDGIGDLKVQIRLRTCSRDRDGRNGAVDKIRNRVCAAGNARLQGLEEEVEILLGVDVAKALKDAELVSLSFRC